MLRFLALAVAGGVLALGALAPAGGMSIRAQEASPAAECPATTPEENVAMVEQWFTALSSGGEGIAELAAEDIVYHDPSPSEEAQTGGADAWASDRSQDYPDLQATVEQLLADDDRVASYVRWVGTQQGDAEDDQGIPATGLRNEWVGMVLFRFECGKIAEIWSVADDLGRLQHIGVITDEELQSAEAVATPTS